MKDDRRYESFEMRAAYDPRYVIDHRRITSKAACKAAYAECDRIYVAMGRIRSEARAGKIDRDAAAAAFARYSEERAEIYARIRKYEEGR